LNVGKVKKKKKKKPQMNILKRVGFPILIMIFYMTYIFCHTKKNLRS